MFSDFRMSKFTGQINKVDLFVNIRYSFEIVVNDIGVCQFWEKFMGAEIIIVALYKG